MKVDYSRSRTEDNRYFTLDLLILYGTCDPDEEKSLSDTILKIAKANRYHTGQSGFIFKN